LDNDEDHSEHRVVLQKFNEVLIVPLPDPVSEGFFKDLSHRLLTFLRSEGVRGVVLDLSSVEIMDRHDFEQIHRVWQTTHLMGTPLVMAGLKPGVAAAWSLLSVADAWACCALSVEQAMALLGGDKR
jgi:rsbT antagonist protein RsbS